MLFDWLGRSEKSPPAEKRCQPLPLRTTPQVEALEDRFMPNAIRSIPGLSNFSLPHEDDSPSQVANVGFNLNFFGVQTNQVFVNNNGDITFGTAFPQFTPTGLNSNNGGVPIIAPFFADVDTRPANSPVVTYGTSTLCGLQVFAVNWINVGYYNENLNKTDTFQVLLIDRSDVGAGDFDIEFNYGSIEWETGDASGGSNGLGKSSAVVGYSNGSGDPGTFFELPGSGVNGALINGGPDALESHSVMAATDGRYHFMVRNGNVMQAPAVNNDVTDATRVFWPLRYTEDPTTHIETGNLTILNLATTTGLLACLDETGGNMSLPGPINVVFTNLPDDIQLANATGFTASGHPYLTVNVSSLPPGQPCARAQIQLLNPSSIPTTTFEMGYPVKVYSGQFDPTML
jgi:Nidogen-like